MIRTIVVMLGLLTLTLATSILISQPAHAQAPDPGTRALDQAPGPAASAAITKPATELSVTMRRTLAQRQVGDSDEERNEHEALAAFYAERGFVPLWLTPSGAATPPATVAASEIKRAAEWGLNPRDFAVPDIIGQPASGIADSSTGVPDTSPDVIAAADIEFSQTVLKYGRFARGGRIINPAAQLSSYLDRRPQFLKPRAILDGIAAAEAPDAYLRGLHPVHPQFERLRQHYLLLSSAGKPPGTRSKPVQNAQIKRLLANMEQWRWMPIAMGDLYVWNNIPEFIQRVVRNEEIVRTERIVAGETGKQTPIFSRPMRRITFKPTWIVPDSIKVRELWPSLLRGGRLMREWGLELRTKEGEAVDWRKIQWAKLDIRQYDVIQPNGPKSVLGQVKYSFPNQHTVFMHDTMERDKYMFRAPRRTYSHGCMRVANPLGLAEILLLEDKGWEREHVRHVFNKGPLNNEIALDRKIPVHITYFTAMVGDDGVLRTFPDVYGHERRITLALDGKWNEIAKGRDHLAEVAPDLNDQAPARAPGDGAADAAERPSRGRRKEPDGGFLSILGTF